MLRFWKSRKDNNQLDEARRKYEIAKNYLHAVEETTKHPSDCTGFGWTPASDEQWRQEARQKLERAKRELEEAKKANTEN